MPSTVTENTFTEAELIAMIDVAVEAAEAAGNDWNAMIAAAEAAAFVV